MVFTPPLTGTTPMVVQRHQSPSLITSGLPLRSPADRLFRPWKSQCQLLLLTAPGRVNLDLNRCNRTQPRHKADLISPSLLRPPDLAPISAGLLSTPDSAPWPGPCRWNSPRISPEIWPMDAMYFGGSHDAELVLVTRDLAGIRPGPLAAQARLSMEELGFFGQRGNLAPTLLGKVYPGPRGFLAPEVWRIVHFGPGLLWFWYKDGYDITYDERKIEDQGTTNRTLALETL